MTDRLVTPAVPRSAAPGGDAVDVDLPDGRRIRGEIQPGFGGVLDAFLDNFEGRGDLGAACAVVAGGRTVVDLWGGIADSRNRRPWSHDTAAVIFSCSKGLVAMCAYRLADGGRLDLDAPIVRYWPEFAAGGKAAITVRDALTHRAGLAALDTDLTRADVTAWDPVIKAIERQRPSHRPADGHQYHTMTYGWIVGEVIRRVTGLRPGAFFRAEIGGPRGLRTWIGLPGSPRPDVAWMEPPLPDEDSDIARATARLAAADPAIERAATMSGAYAFPADDRHVTFNDPDLQAAEIPAANGISTAASLARLYAACLPSDPDAVISPASLRDVLVVRSKGQGLAGLPDDGSRWGTGFQLASPPSQPMLGASSFGHAGAGGQLAFGDVDHDIGFAYLGNQMGGYGDGRARVLTSALRAAVGA